MEIRGEQELVLGLFVLTAAIEFDNHSECVFEFDDRVDDGLAAFDRMRGFESALLEEVDALVSIEDEAPLFDLADETSEPVGLGV